MKQLRTRFAQRLAANAQARYPQPVEIDRRPFRSAMLPITIHRDELRQGAKILRKRCRRTRNYPWPLHDHKCRRITPLNPWPPWLRPTRGQRRMLIYTYSISTVRRRRKPWPISCGMTRIPCGSRGVCQKPLEWNPTCSIDSPPASRQQRYWPSWPPCRDAPKEPPAVGPTPAAPASERMRR